MAKATDGFSGAETEQVVMTALHDAIFSSAEPTTAHVFKAIQQSPPLSVTMSEKGTELRAWANGRCVPAD